MTQPRNVRIVTEDDTVAMTLGALSPGAAVGEFVGQPWTNNNNATWGQARFSYFPLPQGTYDALKVIIGTAGSAGLLMRFGIYSNDVTTANPTTRLAQTGQIDTTSTGVKIGVFDAPLVIPPGGRGVWYGFVWQGTTAGSTAAAGQVLSGGFYGMINNILPANANDIHYTAAWGPEFSLNNTLPETMPAPTTRSVFSGSLPKVMFRRSA